MVPFTESNGAKISGTEWKYTHSYQPGGEDFQQTILPSVIWRLLAAFVDQDTARGGFKPELDCQCFRWQIGPKVRAGEIARRPVQIQGRSASNAWGYEVQNFAKMAAIGINDGESE